jgi:hypothetical protein
MCVLQFMRRGRLQPRYCIITKLLQILCNGKTVADTASPRRVTPRAHNTITKLVVV